MDLGYNALDGCCTIESFSNPLHAVLKMLHFPIVIQVLAEKYLFLTYDTSVIAMNSCDIIMGAETFFPTSQGFVFPENSPYISIFNDVYVY